MTDVTSISLPSGLRQRARGLGINISLTARDAISKKVQQEERKARAGSPNTSPELPPHKREAKECQP